MSLRVLSAADIRDLLTPAKAIEAMDLAMRAASGGAISMPQRIVAPLADHSGEFFAMPGSALNPDVYGAKLVSIHPGNPGRGRLAIQGLVVLFDHQDGCPKAILDGASLTAIRTAAASALATRCLARQEAASHGIFGTGAQAASHLEAISAVRPVERVFISGRSHEAARAFVDRHQLRDGPELVVSQHPEQTASCDIVTAATSSSEPVLQGDWLQDGSHVNLVGAHSPSTREGDSEVMRRCSVYVDLIASALAESGDVILAMQEGVLSESDIRGEIGQVLLGEKPGRCDDREITLYKSLGIVGQDLYAAEAAYQLACETGRGQQIAMA